MLERQRDLKHQSVDFQNSASASTVPRVQYYGEPYGFVMQKPEFAPPSRLAPSATSAPAGFGIFDRVTTVIRIAGAKDTRGRDGNTWSRVGAQR
jgi:hypothetical protein